MDDATEVLPLGVVGDRRQTGRLAVEVDCQAVTDEDFFLLGREITNLSAEGVLLRSEGIPAEVGETVLLSFRPPRSALWIDVRARVVRLVTGKRPGAPGLALRFVDLSPFERELLATTIARFRPPRPARPRPSIRRRRVAAAQTVRRCPIVPVPGRALRPSERTETPPAALAG